MKLEIEHRIPTAHLRFISFTSIVTSAIITLLICPFVDMPHTFVAQSSYQSTGPPCLARTFDIGEASLLCNSVAFLFCNSKANLLSISEATCSSRPITSN